MAKGKERTIMSFAKTVFFVKNVCPVERALRVLGSAAVSAVALVSLSPPWNWTIAGSAVAFALTGIFGFCPMCALAGRRLDREKT
jgi:hypothetical protein